MHLPENTPEFRTFYGAACDANPSWKNDSSIIVEALAMGSFAYWRLRTLVS